MLQKSDVATFTYCWGMYFFLETEKGNFVWEDPQYGGDNTITPYNGDLDQFLGNIPYGRSKGIHAIEAYCGSNVVIKG